MPPLNKNSPCFSVFSEKFWASSSALSPLLEHLFYLSSRNEASHGGNVLLAMFQFPGNRCYTRKTTVARATSWLYLCRTANSGCFHWQKFLAESWSRVVLQGQGHLPWVKPVISPFSPSFTHPSLPQVRLSVLIHLIALSLRTSVRAVRLIWDHSSSTPSLTQDSTSSW